MKPKLEYCVKFKKLVSVKMDSICLHLVVKLLEIFKIIKLTYKPQDSKFKYN